MEAYQKKTGKELDAACPAYPSAPVGVKWEEDELDAMFPKIVAKIEAQLD